VICFRMHSTAGPPTILALVFKDNEALLGQNFFDGQEDENKTFF